MSPAKDAKEAKDAKDAKGANGDKRAKDDTGAERGEGRFPRGLALRLFAYLIAGHLLAGFLFLLFEVGGGK